MDASVQQHVPRRTVPPSGLIQRFRPAVSSNGLITHSVSSAWRPAVSSVWASRGRRHVRNIRCSTHFPACSGCSTTWRRRPRDHHSRFCVRSMLPSSSSSDCVCQAPLVSSNHPVVQSNGLDQWSSAAVRSTSVILCGGCQSTTVEMTMWVGRARSISVDLLACTTDTPVTVNTRGLAVCASRHVQTLGPPHSQSRRDGVHVMSRPHPGTSARSARLVVAHVTSAPTAHM